MPRPAPADYLQPDEEPLHQTGRHPLSVLGSIIVMTLLVAAAVTALLVWTVGFQPRFLRPVALPAIAALGVLYMIFLLTRYWRVKTSLYTITDQRTYMAYGRVRFSLLQTTYDKLTDLHIRQSLFGRIWGFGTVRLETAGTGIALAGVRDPFGYKQTIEEARTSFIRRLAGQQRTPRRGSESGGGTRDAETTVSKQEEIWKQGPSPASLVGGIIVVSLLVLVAVGGAIGASVGGPRVFAVPALFGLFAVLNALGLWVRYRFTRFHVGTQGVVVTSGWLTRRRVETTYRKVTDVTVYQGVVGRLLDYGNITINTAGSNTAPVVFAGVKSPDRIKDLIDDTRRRWEDAR